MNMMNSIMYRISELFNILFDISLKEFFITVVIAIVIGCGFIFLDSPFDTYYVFTITALSLVILLFIFSSMIVDGLYGRPSKVDSKITFVNEYGVVCTRTYYESKLVDGCINNFSNIKNMKPVIDNHIKQLNIKDRESFVKGWTSALEWMEMALEYMDAPVDDLPDFDAVVKMKRELDNKKGDTSNE